MRVLVVCILVLMAVPVPAQRGDKMHLRLGHSETPLRYLLISEQTVGSRVHSVTEQYYSLTAEQDTIGTRVTLAVSRLKVRMKMASGEEVFIDTEDEATLESAANPVVRSMTLGLDRLIGTRISCVVNDSGRIINDKGLDEVRELLPGRGKAPGLCTQILEWIAQSAMQERQLLPSEPVAIGESWHSELTASFGPGSRAVIPVEVTLASYEEGIATAHGRVIMEPGSVPGGAFGRVVGVDGNVAFVFDLPNGRYVSNTSTLVFDFDQGSAGVVRLELANSQILQEGQTGEKGIGSACNHN